MVQKQDSGRPSLLPGVQYLRGICAMMVVMSHANGMMGHAEYFGTSLYDFMNLGRFGVSVFFMISGFIIVIVSLDEELLPKIGFTKYASRRFFRIVPFFWLCIIGYNIFTFLGTKEFDSLAVLRTLFVWPVGELKPNVAWSLRHEFWFYILFAISFLLRTRMQAVLFIWFALPLLFYAIAPLFPEFPQRAPEMFELLMNFVGGSQGGANLQFGMGFLLAALWLRGRLPQWPIGTWHLVAASIVIGIVFVSLSGFSGFYRVVATTLLAIVPMFLALTIADGRGWLHELGLLLGNASFSIYLVHNVALLVLLELAKPFVADIPPHLFLIGSIVTAALFGVVVHKLVEAPLINLLVRRPPKATAAAAS